MFDFAVKMQAIAKESNMKFLMQSESKILNKDKHLKELTELKIQNDRLTKENEILRVRQRFGFNEDNIKPGIDTWQYFQTPEVRN